MNDTKLLLLLVEDNPGDVRLMEEMLRDTKGFELVSADRLSSALDRLDVGNIDAVLLDLGLPGSQGLATVTALRAKAPSRPVIILTARDDENLALESVKAGAEDYLVKGRFDSELLIRTVRYAIARKQAGNMLRESEEQFRAVFETARDSIFISDETGAFLDVNPAACEALGYSKGELIKLNIRDIDADGRGQEAFAKVRNNLVKEATFEVNERRKDGTLLPVEVVGTFFTRDGRWLSLAIARDITGRKLAEEALNTRIQEMEQFNRAATGRELRMIELKREVNELARACGREPPYDVSFADE